MESISYTGPVTRSAKRCTATGPTSTTWKRRMPAGYCPAPVSRLSRGSTCRENSASAANWMCISPRKRRWCMGNRSRPTLSRSPFLPRRCWNLFLDGIGSSDFLDTLCLGRLSWYVGAQGRHFGDDRPILPRKDIEHVWHHGILRIDYHPGYRVDHFWGGETSANR